MANKRCPRCFSQISFVTGEEAKWTDDPIKTPKGEAGINYKGFIYIKPTHIEEIQQLRQQQEEDLGFMDSETTGYVEGEDTPKTTFTPVRVEGEKVYVYKKHLRELRESTEKILEATGGTKEVYFNYDENQTEYNIGNHQLDWHDVDLTQSFLDIKAVHIEDLRHYLPMGWQETFNKSEAHVLTLPDDRLPEFPPWLYGFIFDWHCNVLADIFASKHEDYTLEFKILGEENKYLKVQSDVHPVGSPTGGTFTFLSFTWGLGYTIPIGTHLKTVGKSFEFDWEGGVEHIHSGKGAQLILIINFSNGKSLLYGQRTGDPEANPSTAFRGLPKVWREWYPDFYFLEDESGDRVILDDPTSLNRNLYADYVTKWGAISKTDYLKLSIVKIEIQHIFGSSEPEPATASLTYEFDNIQVRQELI